MSDWVVVLVVDGEDPADRIAPTRWLWRRPLPDGMVDDAPAMRQFLADDVGTLAAKAYGDAPSA